jgi:uncharacterized protein YukE
MGEIRVDPDGVAGAGAALASAARRLADAHAGLARADDAGVAMGGEPAGSAYARMHAVWLEQLRELSGRLDSLARATGAASDAYVETDTSVLRPAAEG